MNRDNPFPNKGSKSHRLLAMLLNGVRITPHVALMRLNLLTVQARASELRKSGWPVRTTKEPHPELRGEEWIVYYFDDAFRLWMLQNVGKHPFEYGSAAGRGKYAAG